MNARTNTSRAAVEAKIRAALHAGHYHDAVIMIHTRYRNELCGLLQRRLGSRIEAEDVYSEFTVRLIEALPRFRGESSLRVWCYVLAINLCNRHHARRARYTRLRAAVAEQQLTTLCNIDPRIEVTPEAREPEELRKELSEWLLAHCPGEPRNIIEARLRGVSYLKLVRSTGAAKSNDAHEVVRLRKVYERTVKRFRAETGCDRCG